MRAGSPLELPSRARRHFPLHAQEQRQEDRHQDDGDEDDLGEEHGSSLRQSRRCFALEHRAPTGIRTQTVPILSRLPLPVGLWGPAPILAFRGSARTSRPGARLAGSAPTCAPGDDACSDARSPEPGARSPEPGARSPEKCRPRAGQRSGPTVWGIPEPSSGIGGCRSGAPRSVRNSAAGAAPRARRAGRRAPDRRTGRRTPR